MYTMNPPDDEHNVARNMQRNVINVTKKRCIKLEHEIKRQKLVTSYDYISIRKGSGVLSFPVFLQYRISWHGLVWAINEYSAKQGAIWAFAPIQLSSVDTFYVFQLVCYWVTYFCYASEEDASKCRHTSTQNQFRSSGDINIKARRRITSTVARLYKYLTSGNGACRNMFHSFFLFQTETTRWKKHVG